MHTRLVVNVCFALVLCACSSGRRALRPSEARDAAPGASQPEVSRVAEDSSPPEADAFSSRGNIPDGCDGKVNGAEDCDFGVLNGQILGEDGCTTGCTQLHWK